MRNKPRELCKNARDIIWKADPILLPYSPLDTYQDIATVAVEAAGDSSFLAFLSIFAFLHLAWGITVTHLSDPMRFLRQILYSAYL